MLKKLIFIFFLSFIVTTSLLGQGEGNNWYFGNYAGLNFSTNPPTLLNDGRLTTGEGSSSVSGKDGNLVFYTDGKYVWSANHTVMPNGNGDLLGSPSSTQSAVICPKPGTYNYSTKRYDRYFIITIDVLSGPNGIRFTEIDMTLNSGMGDVVVTNKNILLHGTTTSESANVALHGNGCDFWIISREVGNSNIRSYLVDGAGVNTVPIISNASSNGTATFGSIKVSPNNKSVTIINGTTLSLEVFDFNNMSGALTSKYGDATFTTGTYPYSVEYSRDNNVLYATYLYDSNIYQYDLTTVTQANFMASRSIIGTTTNTVGFKMCGLQLAPNGKIYAALHGQTRLGVINNPNVLGIGSNYNDAGQSIAGINSFTGGGMNSTLGLPAFPSFFIKESLKIKKSYLCFNDVTELSLSDTSDMNNTEWYWTPSGSALPAIANSTDWEPTIQYAAAGEYALMVIANYPCFIDTIHDTLTITQVNDVNLGNDTTYCADGSVLTLDAGSGYDFYFWQGVDTVQTYTADVSGQYIVEVANIGDNLVFNGDFELGNVGFYSQYNYPITGPPDNAYQVESSAYTCTSDHTSGSGLFYAAGGYTATNEKAWCQEVSLVAGQKYVLSYYAASFNSPNPALLQFSIDGNLIASSKQLSSTTCVWDPFYEIWESNVTGTFEFCILNQTPSFGGNDFMLDDIVLAPLCTSTDTINVIVGEVPHAEFSLIDSCEYSAVAYTDLSTITSPETISTWSWDVDNDGVEDYNIPSPSHVFSAGSYTSELTVTSALGCSKDTIMSVLIYEQPQGSFTFNNECLYDSVGFIDNSAITAPDAIIGHGWNFGESITPPVQSITNAPYHTYSTAGTYNVVEIVGSLNGCYDTVIQQVTIYEVPVASYSVSDTCDNIVLDFIDNTISTTPLTTWNWNFGDLAAGANQNETHTYLASGTYTTSLIVIDNNGCTDTSSLSLTINPTPQVTFNYSNGCLYDTATFVDASIIGAPDNIITWSWDIDGDNSEDYNTQNVDHKYTAAGDYNVTLSVESNNSCSNSLTETISIFPVPQVGFSASTACVNGDATQFVNTSTISSGSIILNGWNFGDGGTSTQESPTHNYQIAASYPVTLAVVSDLGCIDSVTYSIDVLGKPSAAFTQDTTNGCAPLCIAFTDTSYDDIPITNWNWKFENNYGESTEQNPTYCYTASGDYDVALVITNAQGCKDTLEKIGLVTIHPLPISDFTLSPTSTDVLNSTIDFTNSSADAAAWIWNFGDGSEDDFSNYDPSHVYGDTGYFEIELVVINSYLCSDTSYQYVEILPVDDLFVPSAFSPNGDGKNDMLYARGYIGVMYFAVFDRLGKKVFESEDKETGWDGLINGKNALEGVYTWYLQAEVNGAAYKLKGDVTLVR